MYNEVMLIIIPAVLLIVFILWALFRFTRGGHDSQYSKTRNWVDFDAGIDSNKVGSREYPTAGVDSVLKHEFLDSLDEKQEK
jgi:hypothetical protein